jgi:hypothetical protein
MAKQYMPLEDCSGSAVLGGEIPQLRPPAFSDAPKYTTFSYTYYPGVSEIYEAVAPNISTRFYAIEAAIDFSKAKGDLQAVLMAHGGYFGEHGFYIYQGKLCYVFDILAAVKRTAIPHHATFLGWSLNGVDASQEGYCYLSGSLMPSDPSVLSVRMPDGHFEQVEKISCSTLFPRKFYSFKAEFEVFSERNPLLSVVKVQFLAWLSLFPL